LFIHASASTKRARQRVLGDEGVFGKLAVDPGHDGQDLRDRLPVDHQRGHLPARIDGQVFGAALLVLVQLDGHRLERGAGQLEHGVRHERAGAEA
jgi:hypothetical protein